MLRQSEEVRRLLAIRNSRFVLSRHFFDLVITDEAFQRILNPEPNSTSSQRDLKSRGSRLIGRLHPWFWPRIVDARAWAESTSKEGWRPENYLRDQPRRLLQRLVDTTDVSMSVLDLGCNCGSDLNILRRLGYEHLFGVDAGRSALELFRTTYPETWELASVQHSLFQQYLRNRPSRSIDVIHSHGATLELVHPSFPIVAEICRVARRSIYIEIQELGHSYPREYIRDFERHGFKLVFSERPEDLVELPSLLQFERGPS